jgi:hypothetical protein
VNQFLQIPSSLLTRDGNDRSPDTLRAIDLKAVAHTGCLSKIMDQVSKALIQSLRIC